MSRASGEAERRILHLLHGRKTRTQLTQILAHLLRHQLHQSNHILAHFVTVCGFLDKMAYADILFRQTHNPNILLFNSMIKGYSFSGPFERSIHMFSLMKKRGIWPDDFSFSPLLKTCSNLCDLKLGQGVHADVLGRGFECFSLIRIGLVDLYCKCERMEEARKVFDEMLHRDVLVWNLMAWGYCKIGEIELGLQVFRHMRERSVVSWNSMISGLAQSGRDSEAIKLFHEMQDNGFEPDEATVVIMLPVCARLGEDNVGQWIHSYAKSRGLYHDCISVGNALVDFFCKRGVLKNAFAIFKEMPQKNVVSWNAMISGLAFNGKGERGLALFEEMLSEGESPNESTFVSCLACCSHAGMVQRGRELFASMISNHHIKPKLQHYGCMVDLLGRSGCVKEAHELILTMPMKPNAALWGALLSACRNNNEMELAEHAVKELINLEPWNSGNYVLLSNIYAERGKFTEAEKVRELMRENSVVKAPGQSSVG